MDQHNKLIVVLVPQEMEHFKMSANSLLTSAAEGLFNFFGAQATNKANQEVANKNIASQAGNQAKGLEALTGGTAFSDTSQEGGGFRTTQPGDESAAKTREIAALGDIGRQNFRNNASNNFSFELPDRDAARALVQSDINTTQRNFGNQADKVIEAQRRNFGGVNNSGETPATLDKLYELSQNFDFGKERQALNLLNKAKSADLSTQQNINAAFAPQAPAPGFTGGNPAAGQAGNVIAQTPPPAPAIDLSGAIAPAAVSSTLRNVFAQQQATQQNKQFLDALRTLGNQG